MPSGPHCGLGEIRLPSLQPGSSIMPGKLIPVIPEAVIQVAAQVIGNDAAVAFGGQGGYFELNTMLPVIASNLLQSIDLLSAVGRLLAEKCVNGITDNRDQCAANIEQSLAMSTYPAPSIGYDKASAVAKQAYAAGKTIREVVLAEKIMSEEQFDALLQGLHATK